MSTLNYINYDPEDIKSVIMEALETACGGPLSPGDERRIFGESALTSIFVALFAAANDGCRQKMLRFARDEYLDAIGETWRCPRKQAIAAKTTLRFSLAAPVVYTVSIPAGTRCTSDGQIFFATDEDVVIPAGSTTVTVPATATEPGELGNDIGAGQINTIVDLSEAPVLNGVTNTTATSGGADRESDEVYRIRIRFSSDAWSTAGPAAAYRYYAISANPEHVADAVVNTGITHVSNTIAKYSNRGGYQFCFIGGTGIDAGTLKVYRYNGTTEQYDIPAILNTDYVVIYDGNLMRLQLQGAFEEDTNGAIGVTYDQVAPGEVSITIIGPNGEIPSADVQAQVLAACSADDVKPLTDHVTVTVPATQEFSINVKYYTTAADEDACVQTIEGEGGAIAQYIKWQEGALNRDINPDYLRKLILAPDWEGAVGATMVEVTAPDYVNLPSTTLAKYSGSLTVSHEVREGVV